jgi:hypothetical protein
MAMGYDEKQPKERHDGTKPKARARERHDERHPKKTTTPREWEFGP